MQHKWPEPAWIAALPETDRGPARVRFYLRLAAAYGTESGSLPTLSRMIGFSDSYLNVARERGRVLPETAVLLESALGRELFPRELFNDIFLVEVR